MPKGNLFTRAGVWLGITAICLCTGPLNAQRSTNPRDFVSVIEKTPRGADRHLSPGDCEADDRGILVIDFDETKMQLRPEGTVAQVVDIVLTADVYKGRSITPVVPIDDYVSKGAGDNLVVAHHQVFSSESAVVPDTRINLRSISFADYDYMELRIKNVATGQAVVYTVTPQPFGFRQKVTDSLMFVKRVGVGEADKKNGVEAVNFAPSPGVTYGGTYMSRGNDFVRFLRPGVGMNVSFMRWNDPAFDISTGKFVPGTRASDVQIGLGVAFSLFNDALQFTYGVNLHTEQDRQYWGIGISFVNLSTKVASLLK